MIVAFDGQPVGEVVDVDLGRVRTCDVAETGGEVDFAAMQHPGVLGEVHQSGPGARRLVERARSPPVINGMVAASGPIGTEPATVGAAQGRPSGASAILSHEPNRT